jgi:hypothetical protein
MRSEFGPEQYATEFKAVTVTALTNAVLSPPLGSRPTKVTVCTPAVTVKDDVLYRP